MQKLTVNGDLGSQLKALTDPVDLLDPAGELLGSFTPGVTSAGKSEAIGADLLQRLLTHHYPVGVADETGQTFGVFVRQSDLSEWEPLTPEISDEELQRRLNSDEPTYTTAQVLEMLRKL